MTDPLGQSQVLPYIIGLTKKGYQFTLISFEKPERFEQGRATIEKICRQNNIDWRPQMYTKTPPIFSTIKDIRSLKKVALQLHEEKSFDIIHCRSYITALIGQVVKRKTGVKFVFDMRGFWADERMDGQIWSRNNPIHRMIYRYFKKKEREYFTNADYTISLTHNAKDIIQSWKNIPQQPIPIKVIPCCVDLELFNPNKLVLDKLENLKKELHIEKNDFILSYLGSIGTWYMLDEMLDFFKLLKKHKPNAKFLFITKELPEKILKKAEEKQIDTNSFIIRSAERAEVPYYIKLSNFGVFFILSVFSKRASSPTKQGEIMAMGIPVVCNSGVGDTDKVVKDYNSGILVEKFSNASYERAIESLDKTWDIDSITKGSFEFYALSEGINRYDEVYKSVLN